MSKSRELVCLQDGHGLHLFDVSTSDECFLCTGEYRDVDRAIVLQVMYCEGEFLHRLNIECVEDAGRFIMMVAIPFFFSTWMFL